MEELNNIKGAKMVTIEMNEGDYIMVNKDEIETKPTLVVGVDANTREGFIIPLTSIKIIRDGEEHD